MIDIVHHLPTLAVFPVLVGPLQTLLALLPAILLGLSSMVFAAFRPAGFVRLVRFCWRQKLFFGAVAMIVLAWQSGVPAKFLLGRGPHSIQQDIGTTTDWDCFRGGTRRWGRGPGDVDATAPGIVWNNASDKTVLSSPAVSGDRILFATATDIGPFSPEGRGAVVCVDAHSGRQIWRYAPDNYRATFSSPVVHGDYVVCGEGLHQVEDARVTCLDLRTGEKKWELRTKSHVESTAAIGEGRLFTGAGDDGLYCVALEANPDGQPNVLWHLTGADFPDCESSPVVDEGIVYFGLGEGGSAVCAVDSASGELLWKLETPYPVFAPPTLAEGKLFVATGNGNFVQSAADLLEMKLQILRDDGATEEQLSAARERLKPVGEVWCIDLATRNVDWKFTTADAILGAIVCGQDAVYFGSRDGHLCRVSKTGELLDKFDLHEPLISSPALGQKHVYCSTASGRLFCFDAASVKPVWDASLGSGETFASSPTLAHGHVYIGSAERGLLCLGQPGEPEPPMWTNGERGGSADDEPVPESLAVLWQYPGEGDEPFHATAPLMPLDDALYAAGRRGEQSEFIKLFTNSNEATPRVAWSRKLEGTLSIAPVGCGQRLCLVSTGLNATNATLHCLSADDGRTVWSREIGHDSHGLTVDRKHVFAWTDDASLGCFDLTDGSVLWDQSVTGGEGIGSPTQSGGLVVVATRSTLCACDAMTGTLLWQVSLTERPCFGPVIDDQVIRVPLNRSVAVHSLVDGRLLRTEPDHPSGGWSLPDDAGPPVTPRVSLKGRVYFANEQGRIVCLGAEQP